MLYNLEKSWPKGEKNICLATKEYTGDHGFDIVNMAAKYNISGFELKLCTYLQEEICVPNKEYLIDQKYERPGMAAKCKIFATHLTHHGWTCISLHMYACIQADRHA